MRKIMLLFVLAAALCTPSYACNEICHYSAGGDSCDTAGYTTGMACHMSGQRCIDDPAEGCWTATEVATVEVETWVEQPELVCLAR